MFIRLLFLQSTSGSRPSSPFLMVTQRPPRRLPIKCTALFVTTSEISTCLAKKGSQTSTAYSGFNLHRVLYAKHFTLSGANDSLYLKRPNKALISSDTLLCTCPFQSNLFVINTPKYLKESNSCNKLITSYYIPWSSQM